MRHQPLPHNRWAPRFRSGPADRDSSKGKTSWLTLKAMDCGSTSLWSTQQSLLKPKLM